MKNKLSPKWLGYGKMTKNFCLQMYKSNMESLDGKMTKMFFNKLYQSIYVPISQHISQVYPKYVPISTQM